MISKYKRKLEKSQKKLRADCQDCKEFYLRETKRFFDNNLLTLLYEDEEYSFCNYANQCYMLFAHRYVDFAMIVNKESLIFAVRNPYDFFLRTVATIGQENSNNKGYIIDDKLFEHAKKTKENTDKNGHSNYVDPDLDEIIKKYGRDIPERVYDDYILSH